MKKVIHYCWFGKKEKTNLIKKCMNSWRKYCPDYEIIEWNEENFDIKITPYVEEAYKNKKWAFVADYARLWIIYNYGGIYLDTDVELIKPFDENMFKFKGFFCLEDNLIATGLGFGAYPKDELVKTLLDSYNNVSYSDKVTCVIFNKSIFESYFGKFEKNFNDSIIIKDYIIYSPDIFCPYNHITRELNVTSRTIAIHWYGASWFSLSRKIKENMKFYLRKILGSKNTERILKFRKWIKKINLF